MNNALLSMIGMGGNFQPVASYMAGQEMADRRQSNALRNAIEIQRMTHVDQPTYGLTPIWARDGTGNLVPYQMSSGGGMMRSDAPPGVQFVEPMMQIPYGAGTQIRGARTGQQYDDVPMELGPEQVPEYRQEAAGAETTGRMSAERIAQAQAEFNKIRDKGLYSISLIDALVNDPNIELVVGTGRLNPLNNPFVNERAAGTMARIEQMQGSTFLEAYETLKGGGQITQIEGQKAEQAIARLNRAQSPEDFRSALMDLKNIIWNGMQRASQSAGRGEFAPTGNAQQDGVEVEMDGKKYLVMPDGSAYEVGQ